eukprot:gnl/TRDRNA2_/TRDRNA2_173035_c1_seq3.p1 gnl/TRDRNA2_/TRDRNA2_173035_c1~~gnl/TRDRNA2_/TRDRNA2_173035_c1_seq3.p1  ORF type:complete len:591 (+),score=108.33 gnl/TRDRNA2_/TRDRNA2_173035_c1_seq3:77-1774(+)
MVVLAGQATLSSALGRAASGSQVRVLRGRQNTTSAADLRTKLRQAVQEALGEDNGIHHERLADIHAAITPMWRSLVKNRDGLVGLRTMRYVVHRYLLKAYGISFVGLEPHQSNDTIAEAEILTSGASAYAKALAGKAASDGFSIEDIVALIATLESLVADDGQRALELVYAKQGYQDHSSLDRVEMQRVLDMFMTNWIFGPNVDYWGSQDQEERQNVLAFIRGNMRSFEYKRLNSLQTKPAWSQGPKWSPLEPEPSFSFEDVSLVTDTMQKSFGGYSEWYCSAVKDALAKMDAGHTGRVKLSNFHRDKLDGNMHFGESKDYLRELGALDETSSTIGPQVIIPNYIQAASNCIIQTNHYRVCCQNECEGIFSELEEAIGGPLATPAQLLAVIANMTGSLEEEYVKISPFLAKQLDVIAEASQGKIPLHGRLFAQWLHYAFPHECPFPHKSGTARASLSPTAFGVGYKASTDDMEAHAASMEGSAPTTVDKHASDEWMSQWTPEEELLADHVHLIAPWEATASSLLRPALLLFVGALVVGYGYKQQQQQGSVKDLSLPICSTKAHYI